MLPTTAAFEPRLNLHGFFATHPVFRTDEFIRAYVSAGHLATGAYSALCHYQGMGVIIRVHRGVYWVNADVCDVVLLAARLHARAVVAYDGAAEFHGLGESEHQCCYLAPYALPRVHFGEVIFRSIPEPTIADDLHRDITHVVERKRSGLPILVTSFERTLVDCLERIDLGPEVTMVFDRFLGMNDPPLDLRQLVKATTDRSGPIGRARLGLLLSAHPKYRDERPLLDWLQRNIQRASTYATRERESGGRYSRKWHLMVPQSLLPYVWNA